MAEANSETLSQKANDQTARVSAVALQLPPFWRNDAPLWFARVEALFHIRRIVSQESKFYHVVRCIHADIAQLVSDILRNPPVCNQYDRLKEEIIRRTAWSEHRRFRLLLAAEPLGDSKPSSILNHLRGLLNRTSSDHTMIKDLFLQCLPERVVIGLASAAETSTVEQLADAADRLVERYITSPFD